jgi:metal-dependent amidase/aminoacylase/carboxypeptidase family protein
MFNVTSSRLAQSGPACTTAWPRWAIGSTWRAKDASGVAAELTVALYRVVETEGRSTESVTFRVRSLTAHQSGPAWLGGPRAEPSRATLELNLAMYDNALRARLLGRVHQVARSIVGSAGATLEAQVDYALPVVANDEGVTAVVERAARQVIGPTGIVKGWRNPFSDDVGLFLAAAPGCLVLLGTASPEKGITEIWHRPGFDIDEEAVPVGLHILALAALDVLR